MNTTSYWNFQCLTTAAQRQAVEALIKLHKWHYDFPQYLRSESPFNGDLVLVFSCRNQRVGYNFPSSPPENCGEVIPFDLNKINDILSGKLTPAPVCGFKVGNYVKSTDSDRVYFVFMINYTNHTFLGIMVKGDSSQIGKRVKANWGVVEPCNLLIQCEGKCED